MDTQRIDASIEELQTAKTRWARLPVAKKLGYIDGLRQATFEHSRRWVEHETTAKGLTMNSPLAGEEWITGPFGVIDALNSLEVTLSRIDGAIDVLKGHSVRTKPNGQVVVDVMPTTTVERLLFSGSRAEVWMDSSITVGNVRDHVGVFYDEVGPQGAVCAVMGAGNVASIAPLDVIYKLFTEGEVAILKMNPVNEHLGEVFEDIFGDLIRDGYLRIAYGDVEVGAYLVAHPGVDTIHLTGSANTYYAIRYGTGAEGRANREADTPINSKPVKAELGGVNPTIVVPGNWSKADLRFHADHVVTQKMNNSGFNCIAAQILVLPESWELSEPFITEVRNELASLEDRDAYYPGTRDRCDAVVTGSGSVETFGVDHKRFLVTGLDPAATRDAAFTSEYFAPALAVVKLPSPDVSTYLENAVTFANDVLEGSLGATFIIHPKTEKSNTAAFNMAIEDLEYGGIGINIWNAAVYLQSRCPWGAYPGGTPTDIGSGVGVVHNTLMLERTQKSIYRAPFAPYHRTATKGEVHFAPKPIWYLSNKNMHTTTELLVNYSATGRTGDLVKLMASAMRG
jgi:aldehyde dehydrogenase (NAD(P)+)